MKRAIVWILCLPLFPAATAAQSGPWLQYATPSEAGFDASALDRVRVLADSARSGALMAIYRGHVIGAWGDVAREFQAHSVRKSLLSALYGIAVADGDVDLDATLAQLGVLDDPPLTQAERRARVRDLIAARSGVYHPAAYAASEANESMPARGSAKPGERFHYNNWDFNVAGVIYERLTGEGLYEAFGRRIARPLGMEDYDAADGFLVFEPTSSIHPAHTFRISARDLARFGRLYLQRGRWDGEQVVPEAWIAESTSALSDLGRGRGYGYMWWMYAAGSLGERYPALSAHDVVLARGTGGQALFLVPGLDLAVVHRGDTDNGREVSGSVIWKLLDLIVAARSGDAAAEPRLVAMAPVMLASQVPAPDPLRVLALEGVEVAAYLGDYLFQPGDRVGRTFLFDDRLFLFVPGLGDAELFPTALDRFTVRVVPDVTIRYERDDGGRVTGLVLTYRGSDMRGARR